MVLIPDHLQRQLYAEAIAPSLVEGDALFFAHGLNIRYGLITPPADVDVVHGRAQGARPPGPAPVRAGPRACPCSSAVEQDATGNAWPLGPGLRQGASAAPARAR